MYYLVQGTYQAWMIASGGAKRQSLETCFIPRTLRVVNVVSLVLTYYRQSPKNKTGEM